MTEPAPIQILATGPDWTWYCDATIAMHATDHSRRRGQCKCGWLTSGVHPSQMRELLDLCEQHLATSSQRRSEYLASRPRDPRVNEPGYIEELDAQISGGLDEIRAIADEMEQRRG